MLQELHFKWEFREMNMSLTISWRRWSPNNEKHDTKDLLAKVIRRGLRDTKEDEQQKIHEFFELWDYWNKQYPERFILITLTARPWGLSSISSQQLRLWFGEPRSFRPEYVDSCGDNLIVHIHGEDEQLLSLVRVMRNGKDFREGEEGGCRTWRRISSSTISAK